jgi:type IV pilus assembly protein PilW
MKVSLEADYGWRQSALQHGLTLVELLIALVMGLVLLAGLATIFIANKQTYRHQDALARLQENGRFSIELLSRDIRNAGNTGVLDVNLVADTVVPQDANKLKGKDAKTCTETAPASGLINIIDGFDVGASSVPPEVAYLSPAPLPNTDVLRVAAGTELGVKILKQPGGPGNKKCDGPVSAVLQVQGCSGLKSGQVVIAVDATGSIAAQFVVQKLTSEAGEDKCALDNHANVIHNTGTVDLPDGGLAPVKNCSKCLAGDYTGGFLVDFQRNVYYIGQNPTTGIPGLYRSVNFGTPQELVEGVENMQIRYGLGTNPSTRAVDDDGYKDETEIWNDGQWQNVRSAHLQLLLQSPDANALQDPNKLTFVAGVSNEFENWDKAYAANASVADKRWRQVYSTTVGLRNRLP